MITFFSDTLSMLRDMRLLLSVIIGVTEYGHTCRSGPNFERRFRKKNGDHTLGI